MEEDRKIGCAAIGQSSLESGENRIEILKLKIDYFYLYSRVTIDEKNSRYWTAP